MAKLLTRQQRIQMGAQRVAEPEALPIAVTGWNTRDVLTGMSATDAIILDNWYPDANGLTLRQGYITWATGLGAGAVPTLAEYNFGGTRKLLAASGGKFFDVSAQGAVGAALASGFGRDWWNTIAFNQKLFFFNGTDTPQVFDGAAFSNTGLTGPGSVANWLGGTAYQNRLFLIERNRTGFWFGPLLGISGACTFFDFSMLTELGGTLTAIVTFSYDGGAGVFDYIAFALSSGEIFIYSGTDPSNANTWSLVGKYRISAAINQRAVVRYGGEAYITTANDHVALQQGLVALRTGLLPPRTKASGAVAAAVLANSGADGWQALYYPKGRRILFNVPNTNGTFDQHVYNTTNDAWCRFKAMPAATFGTFKDNLYFGGSTGGVVYQADIGNLDNGVQAVQAFGQQAWNLFGSSERKIVKSVRPVVQSVGAVVYDFGIGFDYTTISTPIVASSPPLGSPWDVSPWDTSPWSSEAQIDPRWRVGGGTGHAVGWALAISAMQAVTWLRTDVWLEEGDSL
jgi:hypothetical protein